MVTHHTAVSPLHPLSPDSPMTSSNWSAHSPSDCHFHPPLPYHHSALPLDLPDLPSLFDHLPHLPGPVSPTGLSSLDSSGSQLYSTAASTPSVSAASASSSLPPSPSSLYCSTPLQTSCTLLPVSGAAQRDGSANGRWQINTAPDAAEDARQQAQRHHTPESRSRPPDVESQPIYTARRMKHRQIDAARRVRELSAISRLEQLSERLTHIAYFDQQHATPAKRRRAAAECKKDKVSVLEEAADRMEALYELIEELGAACLHQYEHNRSKAYQQEPFLPSDVNSGGSYVLSLLPHRDNDGAVVGSTSTGYHSLYSAFFLSASLPMLTVRCDTGHVLDVNSRALALSGWQLHHLIGRRLTSPYEIIMAKNERLPSSTLLAREAAMYAVEKERILVEGAGGAMVGAPLFQQYETSLQIERALYAGEVSVATAVWRIQLRHGRLHELTATQWCGGWMDVPDGKGGMMRQPGYTVCVIAPESLTEC